MSVLLQRTRVWRSSLISSGCALLSTSVHCWQNWLFDHNILFGHCFLHSARIIVILLFGLITSVFHPHLLLPTLIVFDRRLFDNPLFILLFWNPTSCRPIGRLIRILYVIFLTFNFLVIFALLVLNQFLEHFWFL